MLEEIVELELLVVADDVEDDILAVEDDVVVTAELTDDEFAEDELIAEEVAADELTEDEEELVSFELLLLPPQPVIVIIRLMAKPYLKLELSCIIFPES